MRALRGESTHRLQAGLSAATNQLEFVMKTIFDIVSDLDNAAKIPALRAIVHSSMAKCIGAIRQHLREQERTERQEDPSSFTDVAPVDRRAMQDLDMRNQTDENTRSVEEIARAMGFGETMSALRQASILHAVYDWANVELNTIITSKWDAPLTIDSMLKFMTERAQPLDESLVEALADAAKTDEKTIRTLHELQERQDREKLIEAMPEIKLTFNGFGENGYEDSIEHMPIIAQHQLGVKLIDSLNKAKDQVLTRVMRSRRITDLASIPLIEDGIDQMTDWVNEFEKLHCDEIGEAIERGVNVRTLDDLRA